MIKYGRKAHRNEDELARANQDIALVDFKLDSAARRQLKNERILAELQSRQENLSNEIAKNKKTVDQKREKLEKMTNHCNAARDKLKEGDKALTLVCI